MDNDSIRLSSSSDACNLELEASYFDSFNRDFVKSQLGGADGDDVKYKSGFLESSSNSNRKEYQHVMSQNSNFYNTFKFVSNSNYIIL